jgi:hypothetical protein
VHHVFEFLAIAREEDCSCTRAISDADDIALNIFGSVTCAGKGLIVAAETVGEVGY